MITEHLISVSLKINNILLLKIKTETLNLMEEKTDRTIYFKEKKIHKNQKANNQKQQKKNNNSSSNNNKKQ